MIATAEVLILIGENGGDPIFAHYHNHSSAPAARAESGKIIV
jgi:hypothetical protein